MDALTLLLRNVEVRGHIFFSGDYCGDYAIDTSGNGHAHFHVVAKGECWLRLGYDVQPRPLRAGDLVVFPRDAGHQLIPHPPNRLPQIGDGFVSLICGHYEFCSKRMNPVFDALPDFVVLHAEDRPEDGWLDTLLRFMRYEAQTDSPGAGMVIDQLADVLLVYILRALIADKRLNIGLLRAFSDPAITRALSAMLEHPEKPWSVSSLAGVAAISRTAFSQRFHELLGMTPAAYLANYRMDVASGWLRQGELSMDQVAEQVGYASTAAFAKAFKKLTGQSPGKLRRGR